MTHFPVYTEDIYSFSEAREQWQSRNAVVHVLQSRQSAKCGAL